MSSEIEIVIGNKGADYVSIRPRRSSRVEIEVSCDGWSGRTLGWFFKGEFSGFAEEIRRLHRALRGTAQLKPIEPNIFLTLTGDGKGHVKVTGVAQNHFEQTTKLTFEFSIDQTYLSAIADALTAADPMLDSFQ